ncbi:peptidase C15, pyroglutamyl peptidase I-like protein [Parathielavia hyrcaniae]|uniref:Peptidase C15, pyroglutamyl peptidase I-like protein n=1 Tax=Parathielavia hyrcaniae TaxID=113614 RepID=A0AAN6Q8B5_9PEZI|nr:peptidase C15, pyroglutamyl peptidase I-like protein [Parathielavia hyrcaniae]
MGSANRDGSDETFTVLVTGFAPFKRDYPVNPSWEIARSLPDWLHPLRAKAPRLPSSSHPQHSPLTSFPPTTTTSSSSTSPHPSTTTSPGNVPPRPAPPLPAVRILTHPSPIRVTYATVRDLVPRLWDLDGTTHPGRPGIDAVIHIGMAGPRLFYSIERRGHRDGYCMPDVDGLLPEGGTVGREGKGDGEGKRLVPGELETDFDIEDVLGRWRGYAPSHMDLRISEDAGHYLCDFIYFSSLAHLCKAGERRRVLFLHVPSDASAHNIALGRELVLQLIRSVVESEMLRKGTADKEASGSGS